jgi:UDP-N-acetylmuramate dehydrogenase
MTGEDISARLVEIKRVLEDWFKGSLEMASPLAPLTTFHIGGPAGLLARPKGHEDLTLILQEAAGSDLALLVLGRGSNVLISDEGFPGIVIVLGEGFSRIKREGRSEVDIEAGCDLNHLVAWAIERELGGVEPMAGIPGSIGGAVRMNAGARGVCIGERVEEISVLRVERKHVKDQRIAAAAIGFGYRRTGIADNEVIYRVRLRLDPESDKAGLEARRKEVLQWRRHHQPLSQPSAGSIFRNPDGAPAGELIDACGLKGRRVGQAMVSEKHANFIVNLGGATARDVYGLISVIKEEVSRRRGIELEEEIRLIGEMGGGSS